MFDAQSLIARAPEILEELTSRGYSEPAGVTKVGASIVPPSTIETFGPLAAYRRPVIGLSGAAGSGKSTVSAFLIAHGYTLVKFAGPLKDMCRAIGMTDDHIEGHLKELPSDMLQGKTPRQFMQWLGTEFGRNLIGPTFWIDLWRARVIAVLSAGGGVVTDDCRFQNEAEAVWEFGGSIFRLVGRGGIAGTHASEAVNFLADKEVHNTGTIADLHKKIADLL
jgi:hypothetical protein